MTTNLDTRLNTFSPAVISVFRIVFGLLYTMHGAQKLFAWPVGMPTKAGALVGPAVPVGSSTHLLAVVVPDTAVRLAQRVPLTVREALNIHIYGVDSTGTVQPAGDRPDPTA